MSAELIEIELTETLVFENIGMLREIIRQIQKLGFKFALDDFGSGYSSLNLLKEVPADALKLDRGFFGKIDAFDDHGRYVVNSVVALAKKASYENCMRGHRAYGTGGIFKAGGLRYGAGVCVLSAHPYWGF